jgi:hypothetical protein
LSFSLLLFCAGDGCAIFLRNSGGIPPNYTALKINTSQSPYLSLLEPQITKHKTKKGGGGSSAILTSLCDTLGPGAVCCVSFRNEWVGGWVSAVQSINARRLTNPHTPPCSCGQPFSHLSHSSRPIIPVISFYFALSSMPVKSSTNFKTQQPEIPKLRAEHSTAHNATGYSVSIAR